MDSDGEYRQVLRDAITEANRSWTSTDTLYASLCAAGIGAGSWLLKDSNTPGLISLTALILALSVSWIVLICRYRKKLKSLLDRLEEASKENRKLKVYYQVSRKSFGKDRLDYLAPFVPILAIAVWAIIYFYGRYYS